MERRLAAVLAADVAGYSRLMGEDEAGTLDALRAHRENLIEPEIAVHKGRIVKLMGDGLLAEFPSAVEAVQCAAGIQRMVAESNAEVPEGRRVTHRIGINVGDIIVEGEDIYGDGVNIAARLEAYADPGTVCVSGSVFDQVSNKIDWAFEELGEKKFKNIAQPIRVYRFSIAPGGVPARKSGTVPKIAGAALSAAVLVAVGAFLWQAWRGDSQIPGATAPQAPSIAVLPFANKSEVEDQAYFAGGLTDDIIIELTKVPGLRVISRETTSAIQEESPNIRRLAQDLNTRYVLQGSVRRAQDRVRIAATLTDAATGELVWGNRYDAKLDEIFGVQDEITEKIANALSLKLSPADRENLKRPETANLQAYEAFLRGRDLFFRFSKEDTYEARALFEQARALDPSFARVYAMLAWTHAFEFNNGWSITPEQSLDRAVALADKAISLNDMLAVAYFVKGLVHRERREYVEALAEAQKAIDIDPNYANGYVMLATILYYAGRPEDGLEMIERAETINPIHPSNYPFHKGQALFILKRYDEAIETFERGLIQNPTSQRLRVWLAASYAQAGRIEDAEWEADQILMADPDFALSRLAQIFPFKDPADLERFNLALAKVGFENRW